jgi:hypothetical protein
MGGYLSNILIPLPECPSPQLKHQHFRFLTLVENQTVQPAVVGMTPFMGAT